LQKLDANLLRSMFGLKIITPGFGKLNFKFYADAADVRDQWFDELTKSMSFFNLVHQEKTAEFFWGDLINDPVIEIGWTGAEDAKKNARAAKHSAVRLISLATSHPF